MEHVGKYAIDVLFLGLGSCWEKWATVEPTSLSSGAIFLMIFLNLSILGWLFFWEDSIKLNPTIFGGIPQQTFCERFGDRSSATICAQWLGWKPSNSSTQRCWLVVSTHLKNISQIGSSPQVGMKKICETTT